MQRFDSNLFHSLPFRMEGLGRNYEFMCGKMIPKRQNNATKKHKQHNKKGAEYSAPFKLHGVTDNQLRVSRTPLNNGSTPYVTDTGSDDYHQGTII